MQMITTKMCVIPSISAAKYKGAVCITMFKIVKQFAVEHQTLNSQEFF